MEPSFPFLELTHAGYGATGEVVEVGAVKGGRTVWRMPTRAVVDLYRAGVRFFMREQDKSIEVVVDQMDPRREPLLRTVADHLCDQKLRKLPAFAPEVTA